MKKALIVQGGWEGHEPKQLAEVFKKALEESDFSVEVSDTLDAFVQQDLTALDLIVPIWTMGQITGAQVQPVLAAVAGGVGLAGCHGGMCDAFRENTDWQFMTGGQWVAHPGNDGVRYIVRVTQEEHPITRGVTPFEVSSEQYYMHVDPAVKVLATTRFPIADGPHLRNGEVDMPVIWTKMWGNGRVFYNSLGHRAAMMAEEPTYTIMKRGFVWAAEGKG
ncbi:MAG: ThuA domain-containing protein [Abitibacteriaceae bacterium]|nr:ThuA domain-containing protein [Abditibacteriaceae bacterium]